MRGIRFGLVMLVALVAGLGATTGAAHGQSDEASLVLTVVVDDEERGFPIEFNDLQARMDLIFSVAGEVVVEGEAGQLLEWFVVSPEGVYLLDITCTDASLAFDYGMWPTVVTGTLGEVGEAGACELRFGERPPATLTLTGSGGSIPFYLDSVDGELAVDDVLEAGVPKVFDTSVGEEIYVEFFEDEEGAGPVVEDLMCDGVDFADNAFFVAVFIVDEPEVVCEVTVGESTFRTLELTLDVTPGTSTAAPLRVDYFERELVFVDGTTEAFETATFVHESFVVFDDAGGWGLVEVTCPDANAVEIEPYGPNPEARFVTIEMAEVDVSCTIVATGPPAELPRTGSETRWLAVVGLAMVGVGASARGASRRGEIR